MAKTPKHKGLTGYSLHKKRLLASKGTSIRSVKYPLVSDSQNHSKEMMRKIFSDYESAVGDFNVDSWLIHKRENRKPYSLLDFWLDSLRTGIAFAPTAQKLVNLIDSESENKKQKELRKEVKNRNCEFHDLVTDWNALIEKVVIKESFRKNKDPKRNINTENLCEEIFGENNSNETVKEFQKTIEGLIGKGKKEKDRILKEKYGIDSALFRQEGTITFYPLPELPLCKCEPKKLIGSFREKFGDDKYKERMGLKSNFNALSNYWNEILKKLQCGKLSEIKKQILELSELWDKKEDELEERIKRLSECAKKITNPEIGKSWADYRANIGGKIQSYVSNLERQEKEIEKRLNEHIEELKKIKSQIDEGRYNNFVDRKKDLINELKAAKNVAENLRDKIKNLSREEIEIYRDAVGNFRYTLNIAYNECKNKDGFFGRKRYDSASEEYEKLHSRLQQLPEFPGETAKKRYEKYFNSWKRLNAGTDFLEKINSSAKIAKLPESEEDEKFFLRRLNSLKKLYGKEIRKKQNSRNQLLGKGSMNTARFAGVVTKAVKKASGKNLCNCRENDYFYRNPNSRNKMGEHLKVDGKVTDYLKLLKNLSDSLLPDWENIFKMKGGFKNAIYELLDAIEIEKTRAACNVYLQPENNVEVPDGIIKNFEKAEPFLKMLANDSKELSGEQLLGRFINTVVCSELRGTLSTMTKENYIVRATIQVEKMNKKFLLVFEKNNNRWLIAENKQAEKNVEYHVLKGKELSSDFEAKKFGKDSIAFKIQSSKYQTGFLDREVQNGKALPLKIGDYSLIAEKNYPVNWNLINGEFVPELNWSQKKDRLFVSIPFELDGSSGREINGGRLLGVDTGEYGLAWTVLETRPKLKIVKQGFISHPSLIKIRDNIRVGKTRQRTGVFRENSTRISDIRENAIGTLRNRIHDIAVCYNAKTVYEYEISNFETKSNRISKVYKSVKRADVYRRKDDTDADKQERKLVWGKTRAFGKEIGAFATSNICNNCGESIYIYISNRKGNLKEKFSVNKVGNKLCKVTVCGKQVSAIVDNVDNYEPKMYGKDVISAVREFSRQPLTSLVGTVFKNKNEAENFKDKRGNSSVFVCPFCEHISDCDIQASMFVALKQHLNEKNKKKELSGLKEIIINHPQLKVNLKKLPLPSKTSCPAV